MSTNNSVTIDITPTPRILQMLGQVDLEPRRCFAEFIDNALDEGIDGTPGQTPEDTGGDPLQIKIETPTLNEFDDDYDSAKVKITDNGPGMSPDDLENNLKAGYSGKDPLGNMGLFGVGFNIATARLGSRTKVRTTRAGDDYWAVATIDFRELVANNTYDVDVTFEDKIDSSEHGTVILVDQLETFSRTLRRKQNLKSGLGRMYTSVLENNNVEIYFNGDKIKSRPHCIWSDERNVEVDGTEYPAVIDVDQKVGEGYYCKECWAWWDDRMAEHETEDGIEVICPSCGDDGNVIHREQRVWGWVGIQRFFDKEHYGIDLIRNGRIIEELDKSFFYWENPETGQREIEYPLDAKHWGGRIVGELHIDFVPVTNVKDGFRRENDRWQKVRDAIRGKMSFRPTYARKHGFEYNRTPLGRLFKGYRRADVGKDRLVPGEIDDNGDPEGINAEPKRWAEKFWQGNPDYQEDTIWYNAVERAETAKRSSGNPFTDDGEGNDTDDNSQENSSSGVTTGSNGSGLDVNLDPDGNDGNDTEIESENDQDSDDPENASSDSSGSGSSQTQIEEDIELSQVYGLNEIDETDIDVTARKVTSGSLDGQPVAVETTSWADRQITYDPDHELFSGFGHDPLDSILMEVANSLLTRMDNPSGWTQSSLYTALLQKYRSDELTSTGELAEKATNKLNEIKQIVANEEYDVTGYTISDGVEEEVTRRYLKKDNTNGNIGDLFDSSAYLQYAPNSELIKYFKEHPTHFFDNVVWDRAYDELPSENLKEEAVDEYMAYLRDVTMLAEEGLDYEANQSSDGRPMEIERAAVSLKILSARMVGQ